MLVPGIDLVNHAGDALFGPFWDDTDGAAELYADRPYRPGDPIVSQYGAGRAGRDWLLTHGFVAARTGT